MSAFAGVYVYVCDSEAAATMNCQCPAGSLDISSQQAQGQYAAEGQSCYYWDMLAVGYNYSKLHPYTNSDADQNPWVCHCCANSLPKKSEKTTTTTKETPHYNIAKLNQPRFMAQVKTVVN